MIILTHKQTILDHYYLDFDDVTIRYKKDGYLGRYKQGEIAKTRVNTGGYLTLHVPRARATVLYHHVLCLLRGIMILPNNSIDHINGNILDNTSSNLRVVTHHENNRNRAKRSDNTTGITGISWNKSKQRYVIRRTIGNKRVSTSRKTLEEAKLVLDQLKSQDNSYSKRHGK